uniref:Uncharacterized protein n=1 Tax=Haptolina ericina TaxID=156174 RepID=A0A7S3AZI6_9EUKA
MLSSLLVRAFVPQSTRPLSLTGRAVTVTMNAPSPGDVADLSNLDERMWSQARWATTATTDDGACYIVAEEDEPDPSKQWFFCSDPADDESMQCELVPEWMGSSPDGGHAVWLCSTPKVKSEK